MWHRLQILVDSEQIRWLKRKAFDTGKSIGQIIRELVEAARKKEE